MKKGQSTIITTVLLILITIVIAMIVINFSTGFINKQKENTKTYYAHYDAKVYILTELATLPPSGSSSEEKLNLGIKRLDNGGDVFGVRFLIQDNQGSVHTHDIYDDPPNDAGLITNYNLTITDVKVSSFFDIESISIQFLYEKNKATEILDTKELNY